jgi:hypothetical protein
MAAWRLSPVPFFLRVKLLKKMTSNSTPSMTISVTISDVLAWLGLEASGFGFRDPQAKPQRLALAWLWLGLA